MTPELGRSPPPPPPPPAAPARGAPCANCLHPADMHVERTDDGLGCDVSIAVGWSDGPLGCPCERYVAQGTVCSVEGCAENAVHYRMNHDKTRAFDMCVQHYDEAEPYCERYYELTDEKAARHEKTCEAGGCAERAEYVPGPRRTGCSMYLCARHRAELGCGERAAAAADAAAFAAAPAAPAGRETEKKEKEKEVWSR